VPGASADAGRYVIAGMDAAAQDALVSALALHAERVAAPADRTTRPRAGLFQADTSMDEGWTRLILDQFEFDYVRVSADDVQAGNLKSKIDVLILADDARVFGGGGGRGGRGGGAGAVSLTNVSGGGGAAGGGGAGSEQDPRVKAIDEFVRGGGTLVCFNRSSMAAVDSLKLPVKNAIAGVTRQQFFVGGSLLNVMTMPVNRFMAGMPARAAVFYDSGPVFETTEGFKGAVIAKYPESEPVLASGFLQGEKLIQGKAAAVDVELGQGHVLLLGFRPQWRGQTWGTFRIIFNAANSGK
jgi:hypothetical protein